MLCNYKSGTLTDYFKVDNAFTIWNCNERSSTRVVISDLKVNEVIDTVYEDRYLNTLIQVQTRHADYAVWALLIVEGRTMIYSC